MRGVRFVSVPFSFVRSVVKRSAHQTKFQQSRRADRSLKPVQPSENSPYFFDPSTETQSYSSLQYVRAVDLFSSPCLSLNTSVCSSLRYGRDLTPVWTRPANHKQFRERAVRSRPIKLRSPRRRSHRWGSGRSILCKSSGQSPC